MTTQAYTTPTRARRTPDTVAELDELVWYFRQADADIGYRSVMGGFIAALERSAVSAGGTAGLDTYAAWLVPGWHSADVMGPRQIAAANRLREIHAAFRQLAPLHQAALAIAYAERRAVRENKEGKLEAVNPPDVEKLGAAAGLIVSVRRYHQRLCVAASQRATAARAELAAAKRAGVVDLGAHRRHVEAREASALARREAEKAEPRAMRVLREAHDSYAAIRAEQRREFRADLAERREASHRRRVALYERLVEQDAFRERRAKALRLLADSGVEADG